MKIVDVAEFYTDTGGGVKTYINQKIEAAREYGHEMVIIAPGVASGEEIRNGARIIWVKGPKLILDPNYVVLWRKKEVYKILDRESPDILEGSSTLTGGYFAGKWKGNAVKSLIFHQDPVAAYPHVFLNKLFSFNRIDQIFRFVWKYIRNVSRMYDTTIVSSNWLNKRLQKFSINNPKTIEFGIDKYFFSPSRRNSKLRKKLLNQLDLDENSTLFITISRFHPEKRLSTIINGFEKASRKKPMGLIIFGSGPLKSWIKFKCKNNKHIKLMGFTANRDELADIMASSDFFVHGSGSETFGLVISEAICSGLPVVIPDAGGASDFNKYTCSTVYKTGDSDNLAQALLNLIDNDRSVLVKNCRSVAKQNISSVDNHFKNLFTYYQELLANRTE
jgi:alpha-1,6-mannosyltransferase